MEHEQKLIDWANANSLLMILPDGTNVHAPFTSKPTKFKKELYEDVERVHPIFSKLVAEMVREHDFLAAISAKYHHHMLQCNHLTYILEWQSMMSSLLDCTRYSSPLIEPPNTLL